MVSNGGHERGPRRGGALPARYTTLSFRTEQADFFFRFRSCESVGQRREESHFSFHPARFCATSLLSISIEHSPVCHHEPPRPFFSFTLSGRDRDTLSLVAR